MENNIKRHTVTTVLEYDKDGDVVREEKREDKEYFEPAGESKTISTPFDRYVQYPWLDQYPHNPIPWIPVIYSATDHIDPALRQPATCDSGVAKTGATLATL